MIKMKMRRSRARRVRLTPYLSSTRRSTVEPLRLNLIRALAIGRLARSLGLARWMFDECHDAAGHEPRRTDGLACARDFNHLDNSATRSDLDPTPRARRDDLVGTRTVVRRHHDLDAVTLHVLSVVRTAPEQRVSSGISR